MDQRQTTLGLSVLVNREFFTLTVDEFGFVYDAWKSCTTQSNEVESGRRVSGVDSDCQRKAALGTHGTRNFAFLDPGGILYSGKCIAVYDYFYKGNVIFRGEHLFLRTSGGCCCSGVASH